MNDSLLVLTYFVQHNIHRELWKLCLETDNRVAVNKIHLKGSCFTFWKCCPPIACIYHRWSTSRVKLLNNCTFIDYPIALLIIPLRYRQGIVTFQSGLVMANNKTTKNYLSYTVCWKSEKPPVAKAQLREREAWYTSRKNSFILYLW